MRRAGLAALVLALCCFAPPAHAERDLTAQAACLAKQLRKHGGPEGGRAAALKAHFECFPADGARFGALFTGDGPLVADHAAQLELFFAARGAVPERAWSAKAIGVLVGAHWERGAVDLYAQLLAQQMAERPAGPIDALSKLDQAVIDPWWRAFKGAPRGERNVDPRICSGRETTRACAVVAAQPGWR